jgi:trimeric autotransporter adhesin
VALYSNTTGFYNTASGRSALYYNTTGNYNTAYGVGALQNLTAGNNNTALGYDAQVPNATGSNQVRIGNAAVTYASCQVPIISTSDRRLKANIQKTNLGLEFIKQLNPVFYNRKIVEISNGKTNVSESKVFPKTEYGFIAQELEGTLNACGASDNGIINKDDEGMYSVRYNDLLAPMVKAIQEQQALIEKLTKRIEELENKK